MRLSSCQLNSVPIHVVSHRLENALQVESYRLKVAVLGILCKYYLRTVRHLTGDHQNEPTISARLMSEQTISKQAMSILKGEYEDNED